MQNPNSPAQIRQPAQMRQPAKPSGNFGHARGPVRSPQLSGGLGRQPQAAQAPQVAPQQNASEQVQKYLSQGNKITPEDFQFAQQAVQNPAFDEAATGRAQAVIQAYQNANRQPAPQAGQAPPPAAPAQRPMPQRQPTAPPSGPAPRGGTPGGGAY